MDLFIYLQIASIEKIRFIHPIQTWIKESLPEVICFDADSHSDEVVINYGLEQLDKAKRITVLIEAQPDTKPGGTMRFIEKLIRAKNKEITIFFNGEHAMVEKMIQHAKGKVFVKLSDLDIQRIIQTG